MTRSGTGGAGLSQSGVRINIDWRRSVLSNTW
jgi:hypothetical protein